MIVYLFQNINECVFFSSSWSKYKIFTYKQCWWTPNSLFRFVLFYSFPFFSFFLCALIFFAAFCVLRQPFMNYDKRISDDSCIKFDFCIIYTTLETRFTFFFRFCFFCSHIHTKRTTKKSTIHIIYIFRSLFLSFFLFLLVCLVVSADEFHTKIAHHEHERNGNYAQIRI